MWIPSIVSFGIFNKAYMLIIEILLYSYFLVKFPPLMGPFPVSWHPPSLTPTGAYVQ